MVHIYIYIYIYIYSLRFNSVGLIKTAQDYQKKKKVPVHVLDRQEKKKKKKKDSMFIIV